MVYGLNLETEVFYSKDWEWRDYVVLEERLHAMDCVVYNQDDGYLYVMKTQVRKISLIQHWKTY